IQAAMDSLQTDLQQVMEPSSAGTEAAFRKFEADLQVARQKIAAAQGGLQDVKDYARGYFQSWQKEIATIQDEDVRSRAVQRREEALRQHDELVQAMASVRPEC